MSQVLYVVQTFSHGADGHLIWDHPVWSRDRSFAAALSQSLSHRKSGVLTLGATLDEAGELSREAEILSASGTVPTTLILPDLPSGLRPSAIPGVDPGFERRLRA